MTYESEIDANLAGFIRAMPKAELHVHLEGTIRPATLLALARRHNIALPASDEAGLREFYRFRDFNQFLEVWITINQALRGGDDFELITTELGADAARQNIRYLEVTFTPYPHTRWKGLSWEEIFGGINSGRATARREWGVEMRLIPDIARDCYSAGRMIEAEKTVEWAVAGKAQGVVALGLGGGEVGNPAEAFAPVYEYALANGLHSIPHAGEVDGAGSVWSALRVLKAERIGHGVRSVEDPALIDYLVERQVPLEVCPTSNVCTGAVPSLEAHPLRALFDAGVYVTLNSDDPPMFNTTLTEEYLLAAARFGFNARELSQLSLNAVQAAFLPPKEKTALATQFRAELDALLARYGLA